MHDTFLDLMAPLYRRLVPALLGWVALVALVYTATFTFGQTPEGQDFTVFGAFGLALGSVLVVGGASVFTVGRSEWKEREFSYELAARYQQTLPSATPEPMWSGDVADLLWPDPA